MCPCTQRESTPDSSANRISAPSSFAHLEILGKSSSFHCCTFPGVVLRCTALGSLRSQPKNLQDTAHCLGTDPHAELLIEGLPESLCSPECELTLALPWSLFYRYVVDPLGMIVSPFPRSPTPLPVFQIVELPESEACNLAVDRAHSERNTSSYGFNGIA